MKTREQIITSMCMTYRHDYGLDKHPDDADFVAGMTGSQRKALYLKGEQKFWLFSKNYHKASQKDP